MNRQNDDKTASNSRERMTMKAHGYRAPDIRTRIDSEVEKTLGLLETETPPKASPDFYAAVKRKIRGLTPAPERPAPLGFWRRVLVPALLALMIVVNVVAAIFVFQTKKTALEAKEQGFTALAQEYAVGRIDNSGYLK